LGEGFVDRHFAGSAHHVVGNPFGKRLLDNPMRARRRVLLAERSELLRRKVIGGTRKRRP